MIKENFKNTEERMKKTLLALEHEFMGVRTGRASTSLLDGIKVEYYGSMVPLQQVATVATPEARLITIQPWEKNLIGPIEKAILKSDLGLTPTSDGHIIRLPFPTLTEERRKDLVKVVKRFAEESRVAVRNIRRDANAELKNAEKKGEISEDESHTAQEEVQELTNIYIEHIDNALSDKEKEIMEE
ncbi:MAG: ribosome recycling factor [Gemmatimonadota bacterium]|nr:MAG: ribosome recycling factor [Gemmatimonadota bacterium]